MVAAHPLGQLVIAEGPNTRIRLRVRDDAEEEFRWRSDPENARFDARPANMAPFQSFLDAFVYELMVGRTDREQFAIDDADGSHIGTIMLYNISHESAELGISLGDEAVRGRGLGRETAVTFLRWVWNNRPLRAVYLHVLEWNERALHAFRAAGFAESARVFRDGHTLIRMDVRREWWLLWDMEGRFAFEQPSETPPTAPPNLADSAPHGA